MARKAKNPTKTTKNELNREIGRESFKQAVEKSWKSLRKVQQGEEGELMRYVAVVKGSGVALDTHTRPRRLGMSPIPLNGPIVDVQSRRCLGTRTPFMYDND